MTSGRILFPYPPKSMSIHSEPIKKISRYNRGSHYFKIRSMIIVDHGQQCNKVGTSKTSRLRVLQ